MGDNGWRTMPTQISVETITAVAKALNRLYYSQRRPFSVILHGGEPLLLGKSKLKNIVETLRYSLPLDCLLGIQTNGILITEEILDFCYDTRTTISVSIDGPQQINDRYRVGHDGKGTFDRVIKGIETLKNHKASIFLYSGLLAVVDPNSNPLEVYNFFKTLSPPSINFLHRDGNHVNLPIGKSTLNSIEYGEWFSKLLDIYLADSEPLRIKFLDDLIKLVLTGNSDEEQTGLAEHGVLIIDTNGVIAKNDTLKSSFDGADRFSQNWSVLADDLNEILSSNEFVEYHLSQQPSSPICRKCSELHTCAGGMALHRWHPENGYNNPSVYCADQKFLIKHVRERLREIQSSL
jgi:uncharacterized protein